MVAPVFISGRTNYQALKTIPLFSKENIFPLGCVVNYDDANKMCNKFDYKVQYTLKLMLLYTNSCWFISCLYSRFIIKGIL